MIDYDEDYLSEIIDQMLHILWAFVVVGFFELVADIPWWAGLVGGIIMCLPRELIDQWHGWPIGWRKLLDISMFGVGGLLAGML